MDMTDPEWRPREPIFRPGRAPQKVWDKMCTGHSATINARFLYFDRVGRDMFVGRYNWGTCSAVPATAADPYPHPTQSWMKDCAIAKRNHAYILTMTPGRMASICVYCGTEMDGPPSFYRAGVEDGDYRLREPPWDEPWEKPRRATKREMCIVGAEPIPDHTMLYLDEVDDGIYTGRFRVGDCPEGGTHEAVLHYSFDTPEPKFSFCMFCHQHWYGAPPGFWDVIEPHITVEGQIKLHEEAVRRGYY